MRRTVLGFVVAWTVALLTGCETISQDLSDLGEAFSQPSPSEAARWMIDLNDAGKRRRGTVLIATSPFGAAESNVEWYRDRVANERDPMVLAVTITALARHGEPADALVITPQLEHEDFKVRWAAARGLQRLHNRQAIAPLLDRLRRDETPDVRVACAEALGQYPEDRVFQGLVAALKARELSVNLAARDSLQTLTGENFELDQRAWLAWYNRPDIGAERAFANQQEYLFPTYTRDVSWMERVAFWATPTFETPAPPAGLRPSDERRTYEDSVEEEG